MFLSVKVDGDDDDNDVVDDDDDDDDDNDNNDGDDDLGNFEHFFFWGGGINNFKWKYTLQPSNIRKTINRNAVIFFFTLHIHSDTEDFHFPILKASTIRKWSLFEKVIDMLLFKKNLLLELKEEWGKSDRKEQSWWWWWWWWNLR